MEKYLRKCLDSLIVSSENMKRLEVLVINDGSKDSSSLIAHEYESRFPNTFKVIDKENGNYGSCVNRGLKEATGKYVKVLDADDYFNTAAFEEYISLLINIDADLIITDFTKVDAEYHEVERVTYRNKYENNSFFGIEKLVQKQETLVQMHAITYKTSMLQKMNYRQTEGISYTDQEWVLYPIEAVNKIIYLSINLYQYLVGREGQTMDKSIRAKSFGAEIIIFKRLLEHYNNLNKSLYYNYVTKSIKDRIRMIYETVLFGGVDYDIMAFDEYLKENCKYAWVEEIASYRFKYKTVKELRKYKSIERLKRSIKYKLMLLYTSLR